MKLIALNKGLFAKVDDSDFDVVSSYKWHVVESTSGVKYAYTTIDCKARSMHRLILGLSNPKEIVDHKDHDGLNNTRSNLRLATVSQNGANQRKTRQTISEFKGVSFITGMDMFPTWYASCKKDGKSYYRKACSEIDAAIKYNEMATELHGEFAYLNVIPEQRKNVNH